VLRQGDRLRMSLAGSSKGERRAVALELEVRWVRAGRGGGLAVVGAAFTGLTPAAKARLASILRLRDLRPTIRLESAGRKIP